jgi:hypothetical protein
VRDKMDKNKVEISKIVIKIDGKELNLTLDETKQLRDILDNLLGDKNKITYIPYTLPYITNPYPYWTVTTTTNTNGNTWITCNKNDGPICIY